MTLGKMIPPFLEIGFEVVPFPYGIVLLFGAIVVAILKLLLFMLPIISLMLFLIAVVEIDGYVVIGIGGSVKSSNNEYLIMFVMVI